MFHQGLLVYSNWGKRPQHICYKAVYETGRLEEGEGGAVKTS